MCSFFLLRGLGHLNQIFQFFSSIRHQSLLFLTSPIDTGLLYRLYILVRQNIQNLDFILRFEILTYLMSKQTYLTFAKVSNYATVIYIFKTNLTHVSYITWDKSIATIIFSYFPKNWESKIKLG